MLKLNYLYALFFKILKKKVNKLKSPRLCCGLVVKQYIIILNGEERKSREIIPSKDDQ